MKTKIDFPSVAQAVADSLGATPTISSDSGVYYARLSRHDATIYMYHDNYSEKIEIGGVYSDAPNRFIPLSDFLYIPKNQNSGNEIYVRHDRAPSEIAREISRRLLPKVREYTIKCAEHVAVTAHRDASIAETADRIASIHGGKRSEYKDGKITIGRIYDPVHCVVTYSEVVFTVTVSRDKAPEFAQQLLNLLPKEQS